MRTLAIVMKEPRSIAVEGIALTDPGPSDVVVEVEHSSISTGTERLLWEGSMPTFPGMGYPLVPGYESVGHVVQAGPDTPWRTGDAVFVPGAKCYRDVRALFGGAARTVVTDASRIHRVPSASCEMTLLALAATAHHAIAAAGAPELVIGHGVLGRLIARITMALGHPAPVVHEVNEARFGDARYEVMQPARDTRSYRTIVDASGHQDVIDTAVARLERSGTLVLAGFYAARLSFGFPAAFMKEASVKIAAEWQPRDLETVQRLLDDGALSLDGLVTHTAGALDAPAAYSLAFGDPDCLKMVLSWRGLS